MDSRCRPEKGTPIGDYRLMKTRGGMLIWLLFLAGCSPPTRSGTMSTPSCPDGGMLVNNGSACLHVETLVGYVLTIAWLLWLWRRVNETHAATKRIERDLALIRDDVHAVAKKLADK